MQRSRPNRKLIFSLVLIILLCGLTLIFWKQLADTPQSAEPDPISEADEASASLDEEEARRALEAEKEKALEAEKQQALIEQERLEQERIQNELLALESSYYNEESAEVVLASRWSVSPQNVSQGEVLLVRHAEEQEVNFGEKMYSLQPFGTGFYAYIPVPVDLPLGEYEIGDQIVTVEEHQFETQYLEVSEQLEEMQRDTERIAKDQAKINEARSNSEPTFLFSPDHLFVQPIEGRLTTPFGYTRYVNGELSGRHMALDLAMPQGTPIQATNDGVVVLAEEMYLPGNTIYIDHGMNLFSQYSHLYEMHVEAGDEVKKGDVIGLVGSTGFSTGPHLHFTFWVHNIPVDPALFFEQTPFHWFEDRMQLEDAR